MYKVIIFYNFRNVLLMASDVEKDDKMDANCWFNYETKIVRLCVFMFVDCNVQMDFLVLFLLWKKKMHNI